MGSGQGRDSAVYGAYATTDFLLKPTLFCIHRPIFLPTPSTQTLLTYSEKQGAYKAAVEEKPSTRANDFRNSTGLKTQE